MMSTETDHPPTQTSDEFSELSKRYSSWMSEAASLVSEMERLSEQGRLFHTEDVALLSRVTGQTLTSICTSDTASKLCSTATAKAQTSGEEIDQDEGRGSSQKGEQGQSSILSLRIKDGPPRFNKDGTTNWILVAEEMLSPTPTLEVSPTKVSDSGLPEGETQDSYQDTTREDFDGIEG